ncbi:MAG: hypothetical protein FWF59_01685 [Turicibacter sp.]|nr:hypothetical protein [Turicibacter sp.]
MKIKLFLAIILLASVVQAKKPVNPPTEEKEYWDGLEHYSRHEINKWRSFGR